MRFFLLFMILLVIFAGGCSDDVVVEPVGENNTFVTVNFPNDSLLLNVTSISLVVTGVDLVTPFVYSVEIVPVPGGSFVISANVPVGNNRIFTIKLHDNQDVALFWARHTDDVSEEDTLEFSVTVTQAGYGSASRIKLFRDNLPWDSYAMDNMLAENGFTLGSGTKQYQILSSYVMDTVTLVPGVDLVIISNDQVQTFYDNYRIAQAHINEFIYCGGTIFWEVCDLGWAEGSIEEAGITLPGEVDISPDYDLTNYITSSQLQLIAGLDSVLDGRYASHEGFTNLPAGAVVYTVDSRDLPTLVTYGYGVGWVVMTGQPLEYSYDRIDSLNSGYLLPRVVRFLLGLDPQGACKKCPYGRIDSAEAKRQSNILNNVTSTKIIE